MFVKHLYILFFSLSHILGFEELKLVQIIFAHKQYVSLEDVTQNNWTMLFNNNSYRYIKLTDDMPKTAKINMFNLGTYLRQRYDQFLGDNFTSEVMRVRTTEFGLSKISAQLVNAGLWPPSDSQKWSDELNWQPIPFEYLRMQKDMLLLGMLCPRFNLEETNGEIDMEKAILHHGPLFDYISNHTGTKVTKPSDIEYLYNILETRVAYNLSIPEWADGIFPDGEMYNVTLLQYDLLLKTKIQKQLGGGTFLKEIIINALEYIRGNMTEERKIMMYSGDSRNIVGILKAMNMWSPHIPSEATSLIFELYLNNNTKTYGIKINYYTGIYEENIRLILPKCSEICPLDAFSNIVFNSIPIDEELLCEWTNESYLNVTFENRSNSLSFHKWLHTLLFISLIIMYI